MSRFESETKKKLLIKDINQDFKRDFEEYCYADGYSTNTIAKAFKTVKTICKFAKKKGYEVNNELDEVKLKTEESDKIYLNFEELELIENLQDIPDYLDNARDWLIISCYTGQRVSDFMRFNSSMIKHAKNKKEESISLIHFEQIKTKAKIALPVHEKVMEILKKRNGEFPRAISDQPYNRFIKEVCKKAGLIYKISGSRKEELNGVEGK